MCKIQNVFFSSFQKKLQNSKYFSFLFSFSFLQQKSFFFIQFCAITKCIHNVLYTLHGLVFAIKKKLLQKGSFNQCGKNFKRPGEETKVKKWEECDKWAKDFFGGLEVKILFRCPAEKELFTTKEKKQQQERKEERKKTQISIQVVYDTSLVCLEC